MVEINEKIEVLKKIAHQFNEEEVIWALGASMLLCFKGITTEFHDIDLMIAEKDVDCVRKILSEMGELHPSKPNPGYKTITFMEYTVDAVDVDVMAGFSIVHDGKVYDCSLKAEQIVEKMSLVKKVIPLQSAVLWGEYYRLMGRCEKAGMIERFYQQDICREDKTCTDMNMKL